MKIIGKHIQLIGILLLTVFVGAAAGLYFDLPARFQKPRPSNNARQTYGCPMHSDVVQDHPGGCPKCGMALKPASASSAPQGCESHDSGCCADKSATESATEMRLPPGHQPIHSWPTNAHSESKSASPETPAHPSQ